MEVDKVKRSFAFLEQQFYLLPDFPTPPILFLIG
jgi:hypothetical protein